MDNQEAVTEKARKGDEEGIEIELEGCSSGGVYKFSFRAPRSKEKRDIKQLGSDEREERCGKERRRVREKLSSPVCCRFLFFLSFLPLLAAFQWSEGRPRWVEHGSSFSFKSHSLARFPLRISQRDQSRRASDGKK